MNLFLKDFTATAERWSLDPQDKFSEKWIVHEESSLEGVAERLLMIRDFTIIIHGHDNALNNDCLKLFWSI